MSRLLTLVFALASNAPFAVADTHPDVVVSIAPLHSLVAAVMRGAGTPQLLLRGRVSPHGHALRPSTARALERARLVVWTGPSLEHSLARSLEREISGREVLTLLEVPALQRWPAREGGLWVGHEHAEHDARAAFDPHIWLSPQAADLIVQRVAAVLASIDPANAATYAANAARTQARITALDSELAAQLAPLAGLAYLVLHDAYQPFEQHYGLAAAGALRVDPDHPFGARRLREIRAFVSQHDVRCLFREPQLPSTLVDRLATVTGVRTGVLDPLGMDIEPGPDAWFVLMRRNATALRACLLEP